MNDYDNTNRGSAHPPFPEQKFILQGNLNVDGDDNNIALIAGQLKDGRKVIHVYHKVGIMYENEKEEGSIKPDYSGPIGASGITIPKRIAGWKKIKQDDNGNTKAWMSLQLTEPEQQQPQIQETQIQETQIQEPKTEMDVGEIPF
jgi:hypothetical protein|tara:strand:+ start:3819 stop:4253 length:435 start_codon:yes stop_codon:yes gene_type:complete